MPIGITPELEEGKCFVCGKGGVKVRVFFDSDKGLDAKVCQECAQGSSLTAQDLLAKFGKPMKGRAGVAILPREDWLRAEGEARAEGEKAEGK